MVIRSPDQLVERGAVPAAAAVLVVGFVGLVVMAAPPGAITGRAIWVEVVDLVAAGSGTGCAAWRAVRSTRRLRWSWTALAVGCGIWAAGQALWLVMDLTDRHTFPSAADAAFLLFPVLGCAALLLHPTNGEAQHLRRTLDAVMTGVAVGLAIWVVALSAVVDAAGTRGAWAAVVVVAYPVLNVALLVSAVLTTARVPEGRTSLNLLTVGLCAFVVADIAFAYEEAAGLPKLSAVDLGWSVGMECIALAALVAPMPDREREPTADGVTRAGLLPYLPVIAALLLVLLSELGGRALALGEQLVAAALVLLLMGRQYLTLRQNARLAARLRVSEAQMRHLALHDGLTGLANRVLFRDRLEHAVQLHQRDRRPVAVLFLDLDDFKGVNDSLGHAVGDELLRRVSERLRGAASSADTVARLGGDEFAVLLEEGADPRVIADRIADSFRTPFDIGADRLSVSASIGVVDVVAPEPAEQAAGGGPGRVTSADELLVRADSAMYAAKRSGKARVVRARGETSGSR